MNLFTVMRKNYIFTTFYLRKHNKYAHSLIQGANVKKMLVNRTFYFFKYPQVTRRELINYVQTLDTDHFFHCISISIFR